MSIRFRKRQNDRRQWFSHGMLLCRLLSFQGQEKFAETLELPVSTVQRLESGQQSPTLEELNAYSEGMGVSLVELIMFLEDYGDNQGELPPLVHLAKSLSHIDYGQPEEE
jgi:transcriptional regulator with XRE-family HTH domain